MTITLEQFLDELDTHQERVPLDTLSRRLRELSMTPEEVSDFVQFADSAYQRNLLRAGDAYEALIICWKSGQRSPIHDHRNSSCGVYVLQGTLTETVFKRNDSGWIFAANSSELPEGCVCGSQDLDTHQISNLDRDRDLITMHIYSPRLDKVGIYSLTDNSVEMRHSPINVIAGARITAPASA